MDPLNHHKCVVVYLSAETRSSACIFLCHYYFAVIGTFAAQGETPSGLSLFVAVV